VRALVELSADATAARSHSAATVRTALLSMSPGPMPAHALGMAPDCIALRLAALSSGRSERDRLKRALRSGSACAIALILPAFASASLLAATTVALCAVLR
jgi:hypothetical protein